MEIIQVRVLVSIKGTPYVRSVTKGGTPCWFDMIGLEVAEELATALESQFELISGIKPEKLSDDKVALTRLQRYYATLKRQRRKE